MRDFATFLFGLEAEHPLAFRRTRSIRDAIYTRVRSLDAQILRSEEPIPFAELETAAFRPVKPGTAWGKKYDCAWLKVTGDVPAGLANPVVLLGLRGEGLVWSAEGEIIDSVSTVFMQGDLPHSGGSYRPVQGIDTSGGPVEFFVDAAFNGYLLYEYGSAKYHGAWIAERDDEAFALYYDYLTLLVLAYSTEDVALTSSLLSDLDVAYSAFRGGDVGAARAALASALAAPSDDPFTYSAIGHGHLDMAWLWPLRETRRKAARTYVKALNNADAHPDYRYGTSQPQQMQWMKERHPALFERLKAAVAAGSVELQGSFWIEPDTNLPSGESLVRQALVGRRFLQEEFGASDEDLRLCWLPDTFGYNGNLPQILKKSGMDWFSTIKLAWNKVNTFPHRTFHWEGIDGSQVLVHMPPEGDYNSRGAADGLLRGICQYPERDLGTALLVYGSGDGGGGPGEMHLEMTRREQNLRGLPTITYERATDFFRRLETLEVSHTHSGELYLETHQGTYTTQGRIKRLNRVLERQLHNAEVLSVLTGHDCREDLAQHWRDVLLNQFHDIIPGSSITRVNTEAVETYERIARDLDHFSGERLAALAPGGERVAINLTGFARREHINVDGTWHMVDVAPYAAALPVRIAPSVELSSSADSLSNGILSLRFDAGGEIVSCLDADGVEHARGGLNRLVVHDDPYQFPFDAWDIDQDYVLKKPRTLRLTSHETVVDGPRLIRRHVYHAAKVTIEQDVILEVGSAVVTFDTRVDWHESHRMLRAEFRPARFGPTVQCEIQFGHISRVTTENDSVEKAQFEICAHKWVATEDERGGFALLNDSKYGHRVKDGLVSLNLLRSPTFPDKTADRGVHHFTYAFMPFESGDLAGVIREGYRLNNPLVLSSAASFDSVISSDAPGVVIETLKPAEDGRGSIVRLYESLGRPTTARIRTTIPHSRAVETDLLEREIGTVDLEHLDVSAFEIKTVRLEA